MNWKYATMATNGYNKSEKVILCFLFADLRFYSLNISF